MTDQRISVMAPFGVLGPDCGASVGGREDGEDIASGAMYRSPKRASMNAPTERTPPAFERTPERGYFSCFLLFFFAGVAPAGWFAEVAPAGWAWRAL
jgi:hypothetical protein